MIIDKVPFQLTFGTLGTLVGRSEGTGSPVGAGEVGVENTAASSPARTTRAARPLRDWLSIGASPLVPSGWQENSHFVMARKGRTV